MVKALFRKQMLEVFDVMFRHGRNQKQRTYIGTVISVAALVFVLYILGRLLYNIADVTCDLFVPTEYGWCYFAVIPRFTRRRIMNCCYQCPYRPD